MATDHTDKSEVRLEALADLQVPRDLCISPDGTQIAYTLQAYSKKGEHATSALWIAKVGEENSSRQFTSGQFNDQQPQWSPAGTMIAFKSDRHRAGKGSAIYLFADEKTDQQVAKEKAKDDPTIWGQDLEYHRLRIIHIATSQIDTVVGGHRHVHDFTWSPDARQICFVANRGPDINSASFDGTEIWMISQSGTDPRRIVKFPGPVSQIVWGDCGVYFVAGHIPTHVLTSLSLYELDIESGSYRGHKEGDEEYCCISIRKNQSCLSYRVQRYLADEFYSISDGTHTKVYSNECAMISFDVFKTSDDTIAAITKGDGSNPEEVFTISKSAGTYRTVKLSTHNSPIAALNISQSRAISTRAADGYHLDGMIYVPSTYNPKDGPLATVLIPHGGPYWRITTGFAVCHCLEVPVLVSMGYAVVCPNYRGGSSRGERHAAYARGKAGTVDYTDCIDILRYTITRGWVDPLRVVIGGWSQGGFLSYFAVTRDDFQFRGAICGAGVADWDSMVMTSDAYSMQAEIASGAPWDVGENSGPGEDSTSPGKQWIGDTNGRRASAVWHMRNVKTPVLILHGENDVRVPVEQAIAFYRACVRCNVPVDMVTYPREGHFIGERRHLIDMWERMRRFCSLHLQ
ncbi:hypothetical protein ACN42_g2129 [Penicillium freii]|uniref:Dipeptidyl-peptidase V n=1 Tax=Penicillium freii TaxID=48697 RepID=A0A117NR19_PENFR|nr:hypothetical protein ACN42_g2129 [Penicillium freii]